MSSPHATSKNNSRPVVGNDTPRNDESNDLLSIDSSILQARVHFRRPSLCHTVHETYGRDEYDRSCIEVTPRRELALPHRGDRVYYDEGHKSSAATTRATNKSELDELDELAERCRRLSFGGHSRNSLPPRPTTPVAALMEDSDSDDEATKRALAFRGRRCTTPLPSTFFEDSDSDNGGEDGGATYSPSLTDVSASDGSDSSSSGTPAGPSPPDDKSESYFEIMPPQGSRPRRPRYPQVNHARVPSLSSDSSSSDDSSEGPLSPATGVPFQYSWKAGLSESEACFDGF